MLNDKTILVIDDDEGIIDAIKTLISSQGAICLSATTGKRGIEIAKSEQIDLIVVDYHMPGMNGVECVIELRKVNAQIPIIVFTIDETQEVADKFMTAGANDFATKPIKAPDFMSRINLHIKLVEMEKQNEPQKSESDSSKTVKGIGQSTLALIRDSMSNENDYRTVEDISQLCGLAYQTTYRYLQYMLQNDELEIKNNYGKIGRPKQEFKLL